MDIMNENTRLRQARKLIAEWRKATIIEEAAPRESNRVSSNHIFGLSGSVTGEQGLAKLKARKDEKVAAAFVTVSKKERIVLKLKP